MTIARFASFRLLAVSLAFAAAGAQAQDTLKVGEIYRDGAFAGIYALEFEKLTAP